MISWLQVIGDWLTAVSADGESHSSLRIWRPHAGKDKSLGEGIHSLAEGIISLGDRNKFQGLKNKFLGEKNKSLRLKFISPTWKPRVSRLP